MEFSFSAPTDRLRGRATVGVFKTGLSQGARLAVQIVSVLVLSRLLVPAEFGLFAMAAPVVAFVVLFQDLGIAQALIQKSSVTQREASALFSISVALGAGLALLLVAMAPLVALFYGEPRVGYLTAAMGANILVASLGSVPYAILSRKMQFGALAAIDAITAFAGLAVSVLLAWVWPSVWALYAGGLAAALAPTLGYWIASGWRPSLVLKPSGLGETLRFGANVTGFNLANFFARNLDNVLIGKVWGNVPLGFYDRAYKLLLMPLQQISNPIAKVMLPILSRLNEDPDRYSKAFLRTLSQMLLVSLPGVVFMVGTADVLIPVLLGRQWADAAPIFAVFGLASFLQVLNNPTGWLFMSQNRTREFMHWGIFSAITSVIAFGIGLPYGPVGVAAAYAISEYVRTPILWWYVTRRGPLKLGTVVRAVYPHFVATIVSLIAVLLCRRFIDVSALFLLAVSLIVSFAVFAATLAVFAQGRETMMETRRLMNRSSLA